MELYFCPLFSGSSGNALFFQYEGTRILIDAGKPGRAIEEALRGIGAAPETLSALLITHEHSDHILGAGVLARRFHLPVYATAETWKAMEEKIGKVPPELRHEFFTGQDFMLGDMGVSPFSIPHDANPESLIRRFDPLPHAFLNEAQKGPLPAHFTVSPHLTCENSKEWVDFGGSATAQPAKSTSCIGDD